jgi:hypothetical protein
MTLLILRIEDTRTGQVENRILGEWYKCVTKDGVLIGSAEECTVRLVAEGIAGHHARYYALGHHRFLDVLADDAEAHSSTTASRRSKARRVDYSPFMIGPYSLCFGEQYADAAGRTPRAEKG